MVTKFQSASEQWQEAVKAQRAPNSMINSGADLLKAFVANKGLWCSMMAESGASRSEIASAELQLLEEAQKLGLYRV